ncbi:predicted protein [Plenodomus lingam JN3]|uniref:Predicted protein n=1 Tax=Leptosphaeria maculans (strain JN3 / isolate v23.1.3 / race Av1-4-5-6-7-8) TaxID=985895 RepID=E5ABX9_LEPMJ|nr:predicted protein [Plenodomus lingam JN3]CBY01170.1 predicted protein [Plenodomus lingam JN3]
MGSLSIVATGPWTTTELLPASLLTSTSTHTHPFALPFPISLSVYMILALCTPHPEYAKPTRPHPNQKKPLR